MRVYNPLSDRVLPEQLKTWLQVYRYRRQFSATQYIQAKAGMLNDYMIRCKLKACVVAVSGGIDSAAVLALVKFASEMPDSPIEKILPVLLPVFDSVGATGQEEATERGREVCYSQNLEPVVISLGEPHGVLNRNTGKALGLHGGEWAEGQLVAHTRTPTLYYAATLLTQESLPAIICGTTNRDEGAYLGYFGKASDGLVDVQLISDLHKSEVYEVARILGVARSALIVAPKGDMYDGREDEEVFGAPYDFVELYLYYLSLPEAFRLAQLEQLNEHARTQFDFFAANLENMHRYNRHKYFGASPAVHLELDTISIPEGWKTNCVFNKPQDPVVNTDYFIGYFKENTLPDSVYQHTSNTPNILRRQKMIETSRRFIETAGSVPDELREAPVELVERIHSEALGVKVSPFITIENLLSDKECEWLLANLEHAPWKLVGKYGHARDFDPSQDEHGSFRASIYNTDLAQSLFMRLAGDIPMSRLHTVPDRMQAPHKYWRATGVNPLMRFIRYENEQFLVPHYDDTFQFHSHKKTLMSLVIYLQDCDAETRFLHDSQLLLPEEQRSYQDWSSQAPDNLVEYRVKAKKGTAILFNHRVLHDATSPLNEQKTILRTDVVFEAPYLGFTL